jgi:phenylacetyl-CoA:acceptor oxidoreductase subunit 2
VSWGTTHRLQSYWDTRAACNFIGGGSGSSLLFWAALGLIAGLPYVAAASIGLMLVAFGLIMVWLETGKPWRAFNLFFRPQTSWMTREGIVALPLFAAGGLSILFATDLVPALASMPPAILAALTAALGLAFLYCQLRILHSAQALPAWREPWAMPLLGLSGLAEGLGLYLVVMASLGIVPIALAAVALVLLIARALAWQLYLSALRKSATPAPTLAALDAMRNGFLITAHGLPVVLIASVFVWPDMAIPLSALAGATAALGGWYLKFVIVTRASYIPKFAIPIPPVRGQRGSTGDAH